MLLLNKCLQAVELLFPEGTVRVQPLRGGLEQPSGQPAIGDTAFLHAHDEPSGFEHPQMFGNRGRGNVEWFPEIADRTLPCREPFDHRAPRWVGKCGKYQIERLVLAHRLDMISYADCVRAGHHVFFEAHGRGHHLVVLSTGHAHVLQRRDDMLLEDHPVGL